MVGVSLLVLIVLVVVAVVVVGLVAFPATGRNNWEKLHIWYTIVLVVMVYLIATAPGVRTLGDKIHDALWSNSGGISSAPSTSSTATMSPASGALLPPEVRMVVVSADGKSVDLPTPPTGLQWMFRYPDGTFKPASVGKNLLPDSVTYNQIEVYFLRVADNATSAAIRPEK